MKSLQSMECGRPTEACLLTGRSTKASLDSSERLSSFVKVLGPGLMVCLADSDIGGLFTMATAGARTGYALLALQLLLIPVLYVVQDMVVRLGVCKRAGLLALVHQEMGVVAAWILLACMVILGACAMVSEFSGIVAVGEMFGLPPIRSCVVAVAFLCAAILPGNYKLVERIGLCLGACLSVFVLTAFLCKPSFTELATSVVRPPLHVPASAKLGELVLANIGTVVTPWMLFYQASAIVEKRLDVSDLPMAQLDTILGSVVTQLVMCAVLVTFAVQAKGRDMEALSMGEVFFLPLRPLLGDHLTRFLISAGLIGSSLLAALVVSLGIAWNLTEFSGGSISEGATASPPFRLFFMLTVFLGAVVVSSQLIGMVKLNIIIQIINGVLMPPVVGCVFYLAARRGILPEEHRVKGARAVVVAVLTCVCAAGAWKLARDCFIGGSVNL